MHLSSNKGFNWALMGRLLSAVLAVLAVTIVPVYAQDENRGSYVWKNVQIVGGGFITGIIAHPKERDLRYVRTDIGGAYRWDTDDHRWIPLTDFIGLSDLNYLGVESIGLDPSDPDRLYLATGTYTESFEGNGAMLLSGDRGRHFKIVPLPIKLGANDAGRFAGERLSVDPHLGPLIYFGSRLNGLWKSTDRGNTWAQVASFPVTGGTGTPSDPGVGVIFEEFIKGSGTTAGGATKTVYVGVSDPGTGLYVTNDGGTTWSAVPGQPTGFYPNTATLGPDGNLYVVYGVSLYGNSVGPYAMTDGEIWRYTLPSKTNPAGTWSNITPPKPSYFNWGYGGISVDPNNANKIVVTTMDRYYPPPQDDIYRTTDGGQTWFSIQTNAVHDVSLSPWVLFGAPAAGAGNWMNHIWIDPFDSDHVLYGDGQTVWSTHNISSADGVQTAPGTIVDGGPTNWGIDAVGIEETSVLALISPPSGPAHLLSGLGDIGGFTHVSFDHSPAGGMMHNPIFGNTTGLDFAQNQPLTIARVGSNGSPQFGAYSTDGGLTWTPFASMPAGVTSGSGSIAVSADGAIFVWQPSDGGTTAAFTTDRGATWTASTGTAAQQANQSQVIVLSDRFNAKKFYVYDPVGGGLYVSTDGAQTFSELTTLSTFGTLSISPAAEGDLWFSSAGGLTHSTNSGATFTSLPVVQSANTVGFGKARASATYPTIFLYGQINGVQGIFRSTNEGVSWLRVNDDRHQYGFIFKVTGDPRIFGRVYLGANGRGVLYGDPGE
jgi:photosystem II stability/assembly factor-like uncharacterized protein